MSQTHNIVQDLLKRRKKFSSLVAQTVKNLLAMRRPRLGFILEWGRSPEEEKATHSSTLAWENPMDSGAWQSTVHAVPKSPTGLSRLKISHLHFHLYNDPFWF